MFHGQPYCDKCGYEGPDFMWMWHHMWGFQALLQDLSTLELRTVEVPDNEVFYGREGRSEGDRERERNEYVSGVISSQLRSGERHVPPSEFARFTERDEQVVTDLPCPRCRALMFWRFTGIS
jgi:hypothetical protein